MLPPNHRHIEPLPGSAYYRRLIRDVQRGWLESEYSRLWTRNHRSHIAVVSAAIVAVASTSAAASPERTRWGLAAGWLAVGALVAAAWMRARRRFAEAATEQVVGGILWRIPDWPNRKMLAEYLAAIEANGVEWALKVFKDEPPPAVHPDKWEPANPHRGSHRKNRWDVDYQAWMAT